MHAVGNGFVLFLDIKLFKLSDTMFFHEIDFCVQHIGVLYIMPN